MKFKYQHDISEHENTLAIEKDIYRRKITDDWVLVYRETVDKESKKEVVLYLKNNQSLESIQLYPKTGTFDQMVCFKNSLFKTFEGITSIETVYELYDMMNYLDEHHTFSEFEELPPQEKEMTWEELVEKAINEMDYETNKNKTYIFNYKMLFNRNGEIYAQIDDRPITCSILLAEHKIPYDMWQMMKLVKD